MDAGEPLQAGESCDPPSCSTLTLGFEPNRIRLFGDGFSPRGAAAFKSNASLFFHDRFRSEGRWISHSESFQTLPFAWIFANPPQKKYTSSASHAPSTSSTSSSPASPSDQSSSAESYSSYSSSSSRSNSYSYSRPNRSSYRQSYNVKKTQFGEFCATGGVFLATTMLVSLKLGTILTVQTFMPRIWPLFRTLILISAPFKPLQKLFPPTWKPILSHFQIFTKPLLGLYISGQFIKNLFPDVWRTLKFWKRLFPIYLGYMKTKRRVRNLPYEKRHHIWEKRHNWGGEKVYKLIVEMSGYYIKSAQIFASKSDFMPKPWVKSLTPLFDNCPARSFREVSKNITTQLQNSPIVHSFSEYEGHGFKLDGSKKIKIDQVFASVEDTPIASASIAQVHGAILLDGRKSVIKIQHFNMDRTMHSDLRNIARVAKFLKNQLPFDLTSIVKEIQTTIPLEFDFTREVFFMQRIKQIMQRHNLDGSIVCPTPFVEFCSSRMIVMERLEGIPFTKIFLGLSSLHPDQIMLARLAIQKLIESYGAMLLVEGTFHADPHPGNLFLLPNGKIGLLDYGQAKVLDAVTKRQLAKLVAALGNGDPTKIAKQLTSCGMIFGKSTPTNPTSADSLGDPSIATRDGPDDLILSRMAYVLFDTRYMEDAVTSPWSDDSILKAFPLKSFNQDFWLVIRTLLLLRGLCHTLQMDVSGVTMWQKFIPKYMIDDDF